MHEINFSLYLNIFQNPDSGSSQDDAQESSEQTADFNSLNSDYSDLPPDVLSVKNLSSKVDEVIDKTSVMSIGDNNELTDTDNTHTVLEANT